MEFDAIRARQRVRWCTEGVAHTGEVYSVHRFSGKIVVYYFSSFHRGVVRQEFKAEDLEAVEA
jgi:hypothetical protein